MAITLKAARVNAERTQKEMARALGVSKGTYASYEAYKTKMDIETAQRFALLCGLTVDDIIFFKNNCA